MNILNVPINNSSWHQGCAKQIKCNYWKHNLWTLLFILRATILAAMPKAFRKFILSMALTATTLRRRLFLELQNLSINLKSSPGKIHNHIILAMNLLTESKTEKVHTKL